MAESPDPDAQSDEEPSVASAGDAAGAGEAANGDNTAADGDDDAAGPTDPSRSAEGTGVQDGPGGREVVVPMPLYKTVVVFSTLIAIVSFIGGFLLIDAATLQVSLVRTLVLGALAAVGLRPGTGLVTGAFAVAGLSLIAFGAAVYVLGTRFRFREMGKPQEDSGEGSGNG